MSPWLAAVVIAGVAAAAVAAKLLLRRRAPLGGWFTDSSRGAGIRGVLGPPVQGHSGSIMTTEMRRTIELIDRGEPVPCDARGVPTG